MEPVLVDRRKLMAHRFVQIVDHLLVATHRSLRAVRPRRKPRIRIARLTRLPRRNRRRPTRLR